MDFVAGLEAHIRKVVKEEIREFFATLGGTTKSPSNPTRLDDLMDQPKKRHMPGLRLKKHGGGLYARIKGHSLYKGPWQGMMNNFSGQTVPAERVAKWLARAWKMSQSQGAYYYREAIQETAVVYEIRKRGRIFLTFKKEVS